MCSIFADTQKEVAGKKIRLHIYVYFTIIYPNLIDKPFVFFFVFFYRTLISGQLFIHLLSYIFNHSHLL